MKHDFHFSHTDSVYSMALCTFSVKMILCKLIVYYNQTQLTLMLKDIN